MTVAAAQPATPVVGFDPLLDKSYRLTRLGPEVVAWLAWLEIGGRQPKTLDEYERTLAKACKMYPALKLADWTDAELAHVLRSWPKGSREMRRKNLNGFFGWAVRTRRITFNPVDLLPEIRKPGRKYIDIFTDGEVEDLLALPMVDAVLMHILFGAGLRKGEALALQVRRLKLDAPAHVVVIGGKGDKDRIVSIGAGTETAVRDFLLLERLEPQDYLWYTRPGGTRTLARHRQAVDSSFDRWWKRCLADAGVRYRRPHTSRHTYATRWLRGGGRLETLSRQMGHSSIAITHDLYGHLDTRDVVADLLLIETLRKAPD